MLCRPYHPTPHSILGHRSISQASLEWEKIISAECWLVCMLIETYAHAHQIEATYCIKSVIILSGQVAMISHYTVVSKSIV